ncbi:MAG: DUF3078 domain-containing protein [Bacteroidales bacterium]|nr:DUF3078 domain-containing protein [Bacteroidales bacterium]MCF8454520.1 DUF3078 domain-containing protein [Bacteroidales bacterium]
MKKTIYAIAILATMALSLNAQEEPAKTWKTGGAGSLAFSQVSLSNWAAGGENSISGNLMLNLFANYKKGNSTWDNTLGFGYGTMKQGDQGWRKTDDKIELASKYGRNASKNWYYSALANFKTQMTTGYKYSNDPDVPNEEISNFMVPAYLNLALGMDYKPNDNFSMFISPLSGKVTFVNDTLFSTTYGLDAGEKIRTEFGAYMKIAYKKDIMENVNFSTKIDLFSNYLDKPQNLDVNWEVLITMKINKYLSANLSTTLIYDNDILFGDDPTKLSPEIQFKEVLGIGLSYNF